MSTPDPSKQISLTNHSGGPVTVLLPASAVPPDDSGAPHVYDQALEILSTTAGEVALADGAAGTYVLDQTYVDPKTQQPTYSLVYDLLVSKSEWLVPVANIGVFQDIFVTPHVFDPVTATPQQAASLANAGVFVQTIDAYPTSPLTKGYQQAMSGSVDAGTAAADGTDGSSGRAADAMSKAVDDFFAGTKSFQNVTLSGVVAVNSYYRAFPFVWAKFGSATYYLYSSDGKATSFVGTISLDKPAAIDITKPSSGYTITFTPAKNPTDTTTVDTDPGGARPLTYADGLIVDDPDSDTPQIAVRGTFQLKRTFTLKPTDTQVLTVLSGTVDGAVCVGFDQPQLSDKKGDSDFWNTLFHPKGAQQIFNSIMQIGGALMLLHFLGSSAYGAYKWLRDRGKAAEPTTEAAAKDFTDQMRTAVREEVQSALAKQSEGAVKPPADGPAAVQELADQSAVVQDNLQAGSLEDGIQAQAKSLEEMATYESSMSSAEMVKLESAAGEVSSAQSSLDNADPADMGDVVSQVGDSMKGIGADVSSLKDALSEDLSQQSADAIEANEAVVTEAAQQVEDSAANADEAASDPDPEVDPIDV